MYEILSLRVTAHGRKRFNKRCAGFTMLEFDTIMHRKRYVVVHRAPIVNREHRLFWANNIGKYFIAVVDTFDNSLVTILYVEYYNNLYRYGSSEDVMEKDEGARDASAKTLSQDAMRQAKQLASPGAMAKLKPAVVEPQKPNPPACLKFYVVYDDERGKNRIKKILTYEAGTEPCQGDYQNNETVQRDIFDSMSRKSFNFSQIWHVMVKRGDKYKYSFEWEPFCLTIGNKFYEQA